MARCLYLVSSSASREYIADCIETLATPRGLVHHFRYLSRYVDERLFARLPRRPSRLPRQFDRLPVVVVYLFQEQTGGAWRPVRAAAGAYLPLRCGTLIDAFRDGDVAHFYFVVTDYVKRAIRRQPALETIKNIRFRTRQGNDAPTSYAHLGADLNLGAGRHDDAQAFQEIVDYSSKVTQWRTRSLGSAPLDVTYDVIFFRVAGVFHERDGRLRQISPELKPLSAYPVAVYILEPEETYHVRINTHIVSRLPAQLPGQGSARMSLKFDEKLFRPASPTSFRIASAYDLEYWAVRPLINRTEHSVLSIVCEYDTPVDRRNFVRRELLCPEVNLPVVIHAGGVN